MARNSNSESYAHLGFSLNDQKFSVAKTKPEANLATQRTSRNPVEEYQEQFTQARISNWIPTRLLSQGNSVTSNEIKNCLRNGQSCVIEGKSGIGKSCLAHNLVAELGRKECLAIPLKALFFRGNLEEILDDTVGSYVASTLNQILTHAKTTGKRLILLVDGWNECNPDLRPLLAQKLDKMVNRHQATLLITINKLRLVLMVFTICNLTIQLKRSKFTEQ